MPEQRHVEEAAAPCGASRSVCAEPAAAGREPEQRPRLGNARCMQGRRPAVLPTAPGRWGQCGRAAALKAVLSSSNSVKTPKIRLFPSSSLRPRAKLKIISRNHIPGPPNLNDIVKLQCLAPNRNHRRCKGAGKNKTSRTTRPARPGWAHRRLPASRRSARSALAPRAGSSPSLLGVGQPNSDALPLVPPPLPLLFLSHPCPSAAPVGSTSPPHLSPLLGSG